VLWLLTYLAVTYRTTMRTLTSIIYPGETGRWLVAYNPETGTTTQGKTVEQALRNLKEATALYLEAADLPERKCHKKWVSARSRRHAAGSGNKM
jgi:predicted RNase H-like HicB family nuclease